MENLYRELDNAFKEITVASCKKIIKKIRGVEDKFWTDDVEIENQTLV